jgi:hypothetical protein
MEKLSIRHSGSSRAHLSQRSYRTSPQHSISRKNPSLSDSSGATTVLNPVLLERELLK